MRVRAVRLRASSLRLFLPTAVHLLQNLRCDLLDACSGSFIGRLRSQKQCRLQRNLSCYSALVRLPL